MSASNGAAALPRPAARAAFLDLFADSPAWPVPVHARPLSLDECEPWLRLVLTDGIGPLTALKLLSRFGLPEQLFAVDAAELQATLGPKLADALLGRCERREAVLRRCLDWAAAGGAGPARHVLPLIDPRYPPRLLDLADPPPVLFALGDPCRLAQRSVAIVGSRQATRAGLQRAESLARALVEGGWTVVSGLAAGIDTAAHRGALAGAARCDATMPAAPAPTAAAEASRARACDGTTRQPPAESADEAATTIAVVGNGLDIVYPASNRSLAEAIARHGVVIGELPPGAQPLRAHFPRRNRLIAALARGVLVVEAARQSGSLITARLAAELGRDVFATPGSIESPLAKGCHALIKQGAKLVEQVDDVLDELTASGPSGPRIIPAADGSTPGSRSSSAVSAAASTAPAASAASTASTTSTTSTASTASAAPAGAVACAADGPALANAVLDELGWDPVDVESLARAVSVPAARLGAALMLLELDGRIERLADGCYRRLDRLAS